MEDVLFHPRPVLRLPVTAWVSRPVQDSPDMVEPSTTGKDLSGLPHPRSEDIPIQEDG